MSVLAVLALGSNLGERSDTLAAAVGDLVAVPEVRLRNVSPVVQTRAVGGPEDQPDFLNMVLEVETDLAPYELLRHCQAVENKHSRTREVRWGPRTLDVDIITYGEVAMNEPELTLPHPLADQRAFVLVPWAAMDQKAELNGVPVLRLAEAAGDRDGFVPFDGDE